MQKLVLVTNLEMTNRLMKFNRYIRRYLGLREFITVLAPLHDPLGACEMIVAEQPYFVAVVYSEQQSPAASRFMNAVQINPNIPDDLMIQLFLGSELERKGVREHLVLDTEELQSPEQRLEAIEIPISYLLDDEPDGVLYDMFTRNPANDKPN